MTDEKSKTNIYVEDRLYFIADWVEEKCDLTLEEIVRDVKNKSGKDITYRVTNPKEEEEIKKYLNSFNDTPDKSFEPVSLYDKIKKAVKGKRGRKKKTENTEE